MRTISILLYLGDQPIVSVNGIMFNGMNDDTVQLKAAENAKSVKLNVLVDSTEDQTADVSTTDVTDGESIIQPFEIAMCCVTLNAYCCRKWSISRAMLFI